MKEREQLMSVPKWRRSHSKLDVFYEAVRLRHIVTQMIMRTFGLKTKYRHLVSDKMKAEYPDLAKLFQRIDRYQEMVEETMVLDKYDNWLISKVRNNLFKYSSDLVAHISKANEILCKKDFEYKERILLTDMAIEDLAVIKQEVNFVEEFFDIDLNKYMNFAAQLEKVKNYLYKWKRSIVKEYDRFLKEEAEWKGVE